VTDFPWVCCVAFAAEQGSASSVHSAVGIPLDKLTEYSPGPCVDLLTDLGPSVAYLPMSSAYLSMSSLASALDASSTMQCPFLLPAWNGSTCVPLHCEDVKDFCNVQG
jgi:hypothetical protein